MPGPSLRVRAPGPSSEHRAANWSPPTRAFSVAGTLHAESLPAILDLEQTRPLA